MPTYNLERWDSVIPIGKTYPYPMVYFKPDKDFLSYSEKNNFLVKCTITDSTSSYDNKPVLGIIDQSGNFPNNRPNFFKDTDYYVITLLTDWVGYPMSNGTIFIQGKTGENAIKQDISNQDISNQEYQSPKPIPWEMYQKRDLESYTGLDNTQLKILGLVLIIVLLLFVIKEKKII